MEALKITGGFKMEENKKGMSLRLNPEERKFIEKVSTIACCNTSVVRDVFKFLFCGIALELVTGGSDFTIPYVGKFNIKTQIKPGIKEMRVIEDYKVETSPALHRIICDMVKGENGFIKKMLIDEIDSHISEILEVDHKPSNDIVY